MVALLLASLLDAQLVDTRPVQAYRMTCAVMGNDRRLSRFRLLVARDGDARRFQVEAIGQAPWAGEISRAVPADSSRGSPDSFEFEAGGARYLLSIGELLGRPRLTTEIRLNAIGGDGSVRTTAAGACAGLRDPVGMAISSLDQLEPRPSSSVVPRPVSLTVSFQFTCSLITLDSEVFKVDMDGEIGRDSRLTISRRQGEDWPPESFSAPASNYAMVIPPEAAGGRDQLLLSMFAHQTIADRRVNIRFKFDGGLEYLTLTRLDDTFDGPRNEVIGSGPCNRREPA